MNIDKETFVFAGVLISLGTGFYFGSVGLAFIAVGLFFLLVACI